MTLTAPPASQLWSTMPGWGITANLLPPEIVAARRLRSVRKMIVLAMVLVVILGAAGYAYAVFQQRGAESALAAEQATTTELVAKQHKYAEVVQISGDILQIKSELATAMTGDVDTAKLISAVIKQLPRGGTVSQVELALQTSTAAQGAPAAETGGAALDTSGQLHIGTMSLTGTARSMPDVAAFVTRLGAVPGVVGVFPSSQGTATGAVQFTVLLTVTDRVLSHRYDAAAVATAPTGGK